MQKQLTVCSSIHGLYVDGTFKSAPKFFHQPFTIHGLTMCNLHFSYRPINIQRPRRMHQPYGIRSCRSWCECFSNNCYADFETAIHNAVTTVWPGLKFKACRFHLGQSCWRKMQSLGLRKQFGKKVSEVSQFLKKMFGMSLLPPAEVCD